jgi:hypothetical protein
VTILLEEMGVEYDAWYINIMGRVVLHCCS